MNEQEYCIDVRCVAAHFITEGRVTILLAVLFEDLLFLQLINSFIFLIASSRVSFIKSKMIIDLESIPAKPLKHILIFKLVATSCRYFFTFKSKSLDMKVFFSTNLEYNFNNFLQLQHSLEVCFGIFVDFLSDLVGAGAISIVLYLSL